MNLRLRSDAAEALRRAAEHSGRSQQDIVRDALDQYLGSVRQAGWPREDHRDRIIPPRTPYRSVEPTITLPEGVTSLDLLDRDDPSW